MSSVLILLAASLSGQTAQGAFEIRNQLGDQDVYLWVSLPRSGQFLYKKQAIVLRPRQSVRLNLAVGDYRIHLRTQSNSTLLLNRTLLPGGLDRLRVGNPPPPLGEGLYVGGKPVVSEVRDDYRFAVAPQMRVYEVRDDQGNVNTMNNPPVRLRKPRP
jgi:hypothetical protein